MKTSPRIDADRLWQTHLELARIGALPDGGCSRAALSDEDRQARDLFARWCRDIGCRVSVDQAGNLFARRDGIDQDHPPVACGSHLDTQPHGGRFDGISGVLCGLEAFRTLHDHGIKTRLPLELIDWTNEEGVRFRPGLLGSSVFAGKIPIDRVLATVGTDGARFDAELRRIGYLSAEPGAGPHPLAAFFELHIEQGPILERRGARIGVVTGVQGIRWLEVEMEGMDAHAGTTPLPDRHDALLASARLVDRARALGLEAGEDARVTVGRLDVLPNSPSTIPGRVRLVIDFRHPGIATLDRLEERLRQAATDAAASDHVRARITKTLEVAPIAFDADCVAAVQAAAAARGFASIRMLSGAAHDAMQIASVAPTAMIFIPCKDGLSHNEAESATPEDLANGCQVLLDVLLARAG
ncbi:MAG TPA: Zn-dependent hydrolase [Candidatus Polarisedimenticolia bacterium]|jgi:N-carbamoyl-L-amino-acid hydrolase|nr:Zn-dependent hydrolase [Candidatus Polarisedimenticolia bacterium]